MGTISLVLGFFGINQLDQEHFYPFSGKLGLYKKNATHYQTKVNVMEAVEFSPEQVIGKPYARGMLPYGGGVDPDGCIRFAISREESDQRVKRYLQLKKL